MIYTCSDKDVDPSRLFTATLEAIMLASVSSMILQDTRMKSEC